jgi:hypothetical protein
VKTQRAVLLPRTLQGRAGDGPLPRLPYPDQARVHTPGRTEQPCLPAKQLTLPSEGSGRPEQLSPSPAEQPTLPRPGTRTYVHRVTSSSQVVVILRRLGTLANVLLAASLMWSSLTELASPAGE